MKSENNSLFIHEIFWSAQGEGVRAGIPAVFIRLAGCSLRCSYCDTQPAWTAGNLLPTGEVLERVLPYRQSYPESQIVITGGEPLEQKIGPLVDGLKHQDFFISVETNGLHYQDLNIDWWTVSPKDGSNYYVHEKLIKKISEIKLVANKNLTTATVKNMRGLGNNFPIFLQPDHFNSKRYEDVWTLFSQCQACGVPGVRLGFQLHRIYNIP